jgi:hypothetical protein
MTITVTISEHLHIAGANAAWIAANNQDQADAQAYLQRVVEDACASYAIQFDVARVPSGEFVLRFTGDEHANIKAAAETDPMLQGFLDAARRTPIVRLTDQQVTVGLAYLVSLGLLTPERAQAIAFYPIPVKPEPVAE